MGQFATLLLLLAAAPGEQGVPAPPPDALEVPRILPPRCPRGETSDVVVCGRRPGADRLPQPVPPWGVTLPDDDLQIGTDIKGLGRVEPKLVQREWPNGMVSRGIVVRLKVPF